jgi:hypothetical protein
VQSVPQVRIAAKRLHLMPSTNVQFWQLDPSDSLLNKPAKLNLPSVKRYMSTVDCWDVHRCNFISADDIVTSDTGPECPLKYLSSPTFVSKLRPQLTQLPHSEISGGYQDFDVWGARTKLFHGKDNVLPASYADASSFFRQLSGVLIASLQSKGIPVKGLQVRRWEVLFSKPGNGKQFVHADGDREGALSVIQYVTAGRSTYVNIAPHKYHPKTGCDDFSQKVCWDPSMYVNFDVSPGDMMVFDETFLHGGPENDTNEERIAHFFSLSIHKQFGTPNQMFYFTWIRVFDEGLFLTFLFQNPQAILHFDIPTRCVIMQQLWDRFATIESLADPQNKPL